MVSSLLNEIVIIAIVAIIIALLYVVLKKVLHLIAAIIINSILGVIAIYVLDYFFNIGIPITAYTLIPTALFGLPAVGTFVILRLFGIPIAIPPMMP